MEAWQCEIPYGAHHPNSFITLWEYKTNFYNFIKNLSW